MPSWKKVIISGSDAVLNTVQATSFTGSLFGTASYAVQALSASWAPGGAAFPFTGSARITGSLVVTGPITSSGDISVNGMTIGRGKLNYASNTIVGNSAFTSNSSGDSNTVVGYQALFSNTSGYNNTAIGIYALSGNTTGIYNVGIGSGGGNALTGSYNIAVGSETFNQNSGGSNRIAIGHQSQYQSSGNNNTSVGHNTLFSLTTGTGNVAIGFQAGYFETTSNKLYIANSSTSTPLIGGDFSNARLGVNIAPASTLATLHVKGGGTTSSTTGLLVYNSNNSASLAVRDDLRVGIATTSPVTTLHVSGSTLITTTLTVGSGSLGNGENTLVVGIPPNGGTGEGGQILLMAPGGTYTSASMLDNYQNKFRILRGTNGGSDAYKFQVDLGSGQVQIPNYNSAGAFSGTAVSFLSVDANGYIVTSNPPISLNNQGGSYTLTVGDADKLVEMNSAGANNLTVPDDVSAPFAVGAQVMIVQQGTGQTTIVAGAGVTLRSAGGLLNLANQYSSATVIKRGANEWYVFGDLA